MEIITQIVNSIKAGGTIMYILAFLSYVLYWQIISLYIFVTKIRLQTQVDAAKAANKLKSDDENILTLYESVHWQFREFIKNRLRFAGVLLGAAPLLGLLGTVLGMLEMFNGLSMQAGNQTTLLVAEGVKQSLITTQTGLTIAIPAIFFIYGIRRASKKRELELLENKVSFSEQATNYANA